MNMESILDTIKLIACVLIAGALFFFIFVADYYYKKIIDGQTTRHEKEHIERLNTRGAK